jgi:hypothetical protein
METAISIRTIPVLLAIVALTACAGGKENSPGFSSLAGDNKGAAAGVQATAEKFTGSAASGQRCLKEGEPCSILNDECCPGYRCPLGLDPKCVRNP